MFDEGLRMDVFVEQLIVCELKAVDTVNRTDNKKKFKFRGVNTYRLTTFPAELNYEIRYSIH